MASSLIRAITVGVFIALPLRAWGAEPARTDTATYEFPEVEVSALRGQDRLSDIPAAAFVFSRQRIGQSGVSRITTLLQTLPGLYGYQQNSSGDVQVVDPRGFTANGESSYLKLLVNGQDVRDVENGNVDWDWLLPHDVERLEVVEGPGAWLYGDGSEGGIVNLVRAPLMEGIRYDYGAQVGSFGLTAGGASVAAQHDPFTGTLRASGRRVLGWRDRSRERVLGGGIDGRWALADDLSLSLDAAYLDAHRSDPGALRPEQIDADRAQSDTETDYSHPKRLMVGLHLLQGALERNEWSLAPYVRTEDVRQVRTILYQTKSHPTEALTGGAEVGWRRSATLGTRGLVMSAGAQVEQSRLDSKYHDYSTGSSGALESFTRSWRTTLSAFVGTQITFDPRTSARVGFRQDAIRIRSENRMDLTDVPNHTFWLSSPFVGISHKLVPGANVYASYSSAFRAPTLNQLFDRRPFFNPFTFEIVYLSNSALAPQKSHSFEVGSRVEYGRGGLAVLTLYSIRVRDEIDFDGTSYGNISRSWHRGIQLAVQQPLGRDFTATANGTYAPTTIQDGPNDGHQINAVPRETAYGSLRWSGSQAWSLEGGVRYVGRQYLDKENLHPLARFGAVEMAGSVRILGLLAAVRVANLLDREYSDSGYFVDLGPALQEERLYPAAGRSFTFSLTAD